MANWLIKRKNTLLWLLVTAAIAIPLTYVLTSAPDKTAFLPGRTTHGHYQIEMECTVCHAEETKSNQKRNIFTSSGVTNNACNQCHGDDLELASDSHPTRKFKNPENAIFTQHIDALACVTCHREHNEKITGEMGVTIPEDYCAHCHQMTLDNLPSHQNLGFTTCATAGCHNYHDNMALAPSFLLKHYGENYIHDDPTIGQTNVLMRWLEEGNETKPALTATSADAPPAHAGDASITADWAHSAHAAAGINCSACHDHPQTGTWIPTPDHTSCQKCHDTEVTDFLKGKHGMRLAHESLSPMKPGNARRKMHTAAAHRDLTCSSCHSPHKTDRQFAAQEACIQCHADSHTTNYANSAHARLWAQELAGAGAAGSGVSCATCHMPREKRGNDRVVNHNQNANLTPNEKMLRGVCMDCHGLQFAMDALSDRSLIEANFAGRPTETHPGISWTVDSAVARGDEDIIELKKYLETLTNDSGESPDSAKTK